MTKFVDIRGQISVNLEKKLKEKGRNLVCPTCGNNGFILAEGFGTEPLQADLAGFVLGGPNMPEVIAVCDHCGYVMKFSAVVLGLVSPKKVEQVEKKEGDK